MSSLTVSIPNSIRLRAEILAKDDGISFDQFVASALAEKVAVLDASSYVQQRAVRGNRTKFEQVMAKVPDVDPEAHDQL